MHLRTVLLVLAAVACGIHASRSLAQESSPTSSDAITLERIMADPDWLGREPQRGYWADDGRTVYYSRKRAGSQREDWFQADLQGNILRVVQDKELGGMDSAEGHYSRDRQWKVHERNGDLFLKDLRTGRLRQLTRTAGRESSPRFMTDQRRILFRRDDTVVIRNWKTGLEYEALQLRLEKDPAERREKERQGFLPEQQQRLFEYLRKQRAEQDEAREIREQQQAMDPTRSPRPWYLGDGYRLDRLELSPNGRWCLVSLASTQASRGEADKMPEFVDAGGYVNIREVRPLVGTGKAVSDKLLLLDLTHRRQHELSYDELPQYDSDPLAEVRAAAEEFRRRERQQADDADAADDGDAAEPPGEPAAEPAAGKAEDPDSPPDDASEAGRDKKSPRVVSVGSIVWNDAGDQAAVQLFSADNKDRWITVVDFQAKALRTVMHRRDPAWINWNVGRVDWLADQQTLYYVTEETGYAQLYATHAPSRSTRRLTQGEFVVRDVQASLDGKHLYYKANATHPGIYEAYRVETATGRIEQLTKLGGMNDFVVAPDEKHLLVTHSTAMTPPELWVQPLDAAEPARRITHTVSEEFQQLPWVAPQFVTVPSRAGRPIHARLYLPPGRTPGQAAPAVIFIHGAGYLQNAHQGWSGYFREFMFHSLLAYRGFVVLDMDYRASAGYGRDWRTAIYRNMGGPEVEDLEDGRQWLIEQHQVDGERVGLYGGSYGGFLTMMALFKKPGLFAGGAALRPVTDWAHYNHGYTSNILNTPQDDPEAYRRSSPINLAEGLADPLLICHGMVDDNVFFKDTARLAQRLIELRKKDWEVAIYPVEPHGFQQPSSWYDEYRRILELMEEVLR